MRHPLDPRAAPLAQHLHAGGGEREHHAAAVLGVARALDQAERYERRERRAHGLRADLLALGELARGRGPAAVQPRESRELRQCDLVARLHLAQPAHQQPDAHAQCGGDLLCVGRRHDTKSSLISFS